MIYIYIYIHNIYIYIHNMGMDPYFHSIFEGNEHGGNCNYPKISSVYNGSVIIPKDMGMDQYLLFIAFLGE